MQITTTTIKHKRYSVIGWNDKNPDGTLKNTLSQGEIGVLLGPDLVTVLEVRMGIRDKSAFNEGILLGSTETADFSVKQFPNTLTFPPIGNEHTLYITKIGNIAYRWDGEDMKYYPVSASPGEGDGWWEEINGGVANTEREYLGVSSPTNW